MNLTQVWEDRLGAWADHFLPLLPALAQRTGLPTIVIREVTAAYAALMLSAGIDPPEE